MGKQMMLFLLLFVVGFAAPGRAQTPENAQQQKRSTATEQKATQAADRQQQSETTGAGADDQDSRPPSHKTHFHLGAITLGASYTDFGHSFVAPFYPYPYYPYGAYSVGAFYTPFVGDLLYGPFYYPPHAFNLNYALGKGEVELKELGRNKNASVYIDNAYAGKAGKLKHMWLDSGAYDLSLSAADGSSFHQRIYVLSGKKLKITPDFKMSANVPQNEEKK